MIVVLCCAGLGFCSAAATEASPAAREGLGAGLSLGDGLVTAGSPVEGEQWEASERARLASPGAVAAREASRTEFEDLSAGQARRVVRKAFPGLFESSVGVSGSLPVGARVVGYPTDDAAQVVLPGGVGGVIESAVPIAVESGRGGRVPVDLGLRGEGAGFVPKSPVVDVTIPRRPGVGVGLGGSGVSLTPVDVRGEAVGGSAGVVDGASVLYAGTSRDADTVVKPMALGFETDTVLRSVASPQRLYFRVGMPAGATLVQDSASGVVRVVRGRRTLARVLAPSARDAAATPVPTSMSVSGDVLVVNVDHRAGSYLYPVEVDPTVEDSSFHYQEPESNWVFAPVPHGVLWSYGESIVGDLASETTYTKGEYGELIYKTQHASHIYEFDPEWSVYSNDGHGVDAPVTTALRMVSPGKTLEAEKILNVAGSPERGTTELCHPAPPQGPCATTVTAADQDNEVSFSVVADETGSINFESRMIPRVAIVQEKGPSARVDSTDATVGGKPNAAHGWVNGGGAAIGVFAYDPGTGVNRVGVSSASKTGWGYAPRENAQNACAGVQCDECYEAECPAVEEGGPVQKGQPLSLPFSELGELPEGEDTVEATVEDAVGLSAKTAPATVKIDDAPPHGLALTGLPTGGEVIEQEYHLKAEASDGTTVKSSGVRSITLSVDGRELGKPSAGCPEGPCTAKGEWVLDGDEFGAGEHTLTLTATDNVGNIAKETYTFKDHHGSRVGVGPGQVNLTSGEFSLAATDVSVAAPGSGLSVEREYRSRHVAGAASGPLGPQWTLSVAGEESLTVLPNGYVTLTGADGGESSFKPLGGGKYESPAGDANLALSETKNSKSETEFVLRNPARDASTSFTPASGVSGLWRPTRQEGPLASQTVRYFYETVEGVSEPKYALAPEPAGLSFSCAAKLEKSEHLEDGCRALEFKYAAATGAKGENQAEWGEYKGRLNQVLLIAYKPSSKAMAETAVAQYAYDKQGRLRREWNPQITKPVETQYAYNSEGQVTAVVPPAQQPWLLHYGSIAGAVNANGYLLSVVRPAASTKIGGGLQPVNTAVPTLSSTKPTVGVKDSIAGNGTWSNSPLLYTYQWEDCNSSGGECAVIAGAVNEAYYPVKSDEGHTLAVQVTAMNKTGAVLAMTAATSLVATGTPDTPLPEPPNVGTSSVWTVEYGVALSGTGLASMSAEEVLKWNQTDDPVSGAAVFPPDEPMGWPAKEYKRATVSYFDSKGRTVNVASPTGGIATTEYNALNDVIRTLSPDNRARALAEGCEGTGRGGCASRAKSERIDSKFHYEETGTEPGARLLSSTGPEHMVKLAAGAAHADEEVEVRQSTAYSYDEGAPSEGGPYNLVTKATTEGTIEAGHHPAYDKRTTLTSYAGQSGLGWKLRQPTSVTVDPTGLDLVHTTEYEPSTGEVSETKMPAVGNSEYQYSSQFAEDGSSNGDVGKVTTVAADRAGDLWVADAEHYRVEEFTGSGVFVREFGSEAEGEPWAIAAGPHGHIWVLEKASSAITLVEFSEAGEKLKTVGTTGSGTGQYSNPDGIAVDKHGNVWVADTGNSRVEEFNEAGGYVQTIGSKGTGAGELEQPTTIAVDTHGNVFVGDYKNDRVEEYNEKGGYLREFGSTSELPLGSPLGLAVDPHGNVLVISSHDRVEMFSPEGAYEKKFATAGSGPGQLEAADPSGIVALANGDVWLTDSLGYRLEKWLAPSAATGNAGAHDSRTIYYSVAANSEYKECGGHPEYASLPCITAPLQQPGTSGLPPLPVTTYNSYDLYDEPEKSTEAFAGSFTRTHTAEYEASGRLRLSSEIPSSGAALPPVVYSYGEETGELTVEKTTEAKGTNKITRGYNTLGQLTSYTDASGTTATYEYDIDGRIAKTNDGKGTQTFTYSPASGLLSELVDSSAEGMKFTATYDVEGNQLTETYPNGMTASHTYNPVGAPVKLEYNKTTHCTEKCTWFSDTISPSVHGETITQSSTLSKQEYTYDAAGRLTQVQNTPAGKGCTTRAYLYDEDTNRLSLTTYEPNAGGECATETETVEAHSYDTADRLTDSAIKYNEVGDITNLPAADAGGAELKSNYYGEGEVENQTQNEQTIGYSYDPARRPYETISTGKPVDSTITTNYAGPSSQPSWTTNLAGETKRNIPGINGQLVAIQNGTEAPVLQLANLHGDIIATAYASETATELASKQDTSEYGVPTNNVPPKYSWLGTLELPTELPSGVIAMGARSYVPEIGRFLEPDPVPGGSANTYSYTFGNPVNATDPSGDYTATLAGWQQEAGAEGAAYDVQLREAEIRAAEEARRAAEEAAARKAAEEAAAYAAAYADAYAGPGYAGEEEWEEWWEEEGEYEYASYAHRALEHEASFGPSIAIAVSNNGEGHVEDAVDRLPFEGQEGGGREEVPPSERCGTGVEGTQTQEVGPGGYREDVRAECRRLPNGSYHRGAERHSVNWQKGADIFCGAMGVAALIPGVDLVGAPTVVACAAYGGYVAYQAAR
jgi:RHS repeat-associated protein